MASSSQNAVSGVVALAIEYGIRCAVESVRVRVVIGQTYSWRARQFAMCFFERCWGGIAGSLSVMAAAVGNGAISRCEKRSPTAGSAKCC